MSTLAEWYSSLVLKTGLKLIITALILTRYGTGQKHYCDTIGKSLTQSDYCVIVVFCVIHVCVCV